VDAGVTEDSNPYFIMEYVDGVSVLEYCTQNQLGKGQKLQLFRQLCGAIRFAHRNLVVHRDLKPNNVFVNNDGQVKVLDFSIAKLLDPGFSDQTFLQTRAGTKLLSPTYCAPEQFEMDPITTATDVYTLGLVLYEILSGRKAMDGKNKTLKEIQASICSPDFSQTLHLQEDSELSAIIMKATRKEPSYRYESAVQLLEDLERYEKALPLIAQRDSVSYRITKFTKRNYKAVSIVLIIIFGSLLFGNYHLQQINEQRELAELEADKATAVTDYMVDLFELANPKKNVGDTLSVFDLLELGKNRIQNFENQPEIRLRMLNTFGDAYLAIGDDYTPYDLYYLADSISGNIFPSDHPEVFRSSLNLGKYYVYWKNFKSAYQVLKKTVEISEENSSIAPVDRASAYTLFAKVLSQLKPDSAETFLLNATDIYNKDVDNNIEGIIDTKVALGILYQSLEEYDKARKIYIEADSLIQIKNIEPIDHIITINNNLGHVHEKLKAYDAAENYFKKAYDLNVEIYGETHHQSINIMGYIISLYAITGELKKLDEYSKQLLNLVKKEYGYEHWRTAAQYTGITMVNLRLGNEKLASEQINASTEIYKIVLDPDHDWTIVNKLTNSLIQLNYNRDQSSEKAFEVALKGVSKIVSDNTISSSGEANLRRNMDYIESYASADLSQEINRIRAILED
jgi:serine/threonine-protein kinase